MTNLLAAPPQAVDKSSRNCPFVDFSALCEGNSGNKEEKARPRMEIIAKSSFSLRI